MRVAFVTLNINRRDGQGRVCFELAMAALREGHEVTLLTSFVEPELITAGAKWISLQPSRWPASLFTVRQFSALADRALKEMGDALDVIHGFGYSLSRPHHLNSAQFVHRAWSESPAHPIRTSLRPGALYQRLFTRMNIRWEQLAFARAKRIVACSELVKAELVATGIPCTGIRVIGNGVDISEFTGTPSDRAERGLPEGVPLFLFAGDIRTPRKNLEAVLNALTRVPQAHLAVVGSLPRSPFPRMAERLGIASRVHFMGFRNDLPLVMGGVDAFVFPAYYEPFGMVVLEAMASALPVITSAKVGASTLLSSEAGIVIQDPADVASLANVMRHMVEHPEDRKRMGAAGRKVAHAHSWKKVTNAYLETYAELAGGPRCGVA